MDLWHARKIRIDTKIGVGTNDGICEAIPHLHGFIVVHAALTATDKLPP